MSERMSEAAVFPVADISDVDAAFPTRVTELMPNYKDIPSEFKGGNGKWNRLFSAMFFSGLTKLELTPKAGIDKDKAWRHIRTICGSWEPKHEHKEAAVAYLLSQWFKDATWETKKRT